MRCVGRGVDTWWINVQVTAESEKVKAFLVTLVENLTVNANYNCKCCSV